jgi:D-alanyl-D-alanine carboxypeptidase
MGGEERKGEDESALAACPVAQPERRRAKRGGRAVLLLLLGLLGLFTFRGLAWAQVGSARYASIVVDADSGRVLEAANPDAPRYPASLTKMMTLYLTFEALRDHRISAASPIIVSAHAAAQPPSKLGLRPGMRITVEEAILALVTKSANDAAAALGERLGGSEAQFAQMMTLRARALGMTHTTFRNASGLPDPEQVTTARDLAILARHLITDFPEQYRYFSVPRFIFRGRLIPNHDHLLTSYEGADGIKTGYTEAAGHNLVTSAVRGNVRLIGVVLGAASNAERDQHMAALLDQGFAMLGVPGSGLVLARAERSFIPAAHAATLTAYHPRRHFSHAVRAVAYVPPAPVGPHGAAVSGATRLPPARLSGKAKPALPLHTVCSRKAHGAAHGTACHHPAAKMT